MGKGYIDPAVLAGQDLTQISDEALEELIRQTIEVEGADRRENQIFYYQPASQRAMAIHRSTARVIGTGGGNGSGKTETHLVECIALATGCLPQDPKIRPHILKKFRGPIAVRVVIENLTTVLENIILKKLQWDQWTGLPPAGGPQGHWGWVPRSCLIAGEWRKSWSMKNRTLTVLCRDPDNPDKVLGKSTIQFMSHEQDASDFASGDYHEILLDEPPKYAIYRECQARTMRVAGRIRLAMTWPDDPSIPVDWIFDEVYERGTEGPNKWDDYEWCDLYTTENANLDQEAIAKQMKSWSKAQNSVRIYGQPIRFSNRIHPLFTDIRLTWSFPLGETIVPLEGRCPQTGSKEIAEFCHVQAFEPDPVWPTIFLLDPHPRKPHMWLWAQIDPSDDIWIIDEGALDGSPKEVAEEVFAVEDRRGFQMAMRVIDPNMGRTPSSARDRGKTWQEEFDEVDLACLLADDSDVGRSRINEYLQPDRFTHRPRLIVHERCVQTIEQFKRYCWDDWKHKDEKDLKQVPKAKYDDYPTLVKYLMNMDPTFAFLHNGAPVMRSEGRKKALHGHRPGH